MTAGDKAPVSPSKSKGNAARIVAALEEDAANRGVRYIGNADHLYLRPPRPLHNADGKTIGMDLGLFVDFNGVGCTKEFFPDRNKVDRKFVEEMDAEIKDRHPDVVQFNIRKAVGAEPSPPAARWDKLTVATLKGYVEGNLTDDHDSNVAYVKACAAYEMTREIEGPDGDPVKAPRDEVLAMLDGLLVSEAALSSAFDAEVTLAGA